MGKHWNYDEARGLMAVGTSWEEIARIFGISSYKARMRLDPVWAKQRRSDIREAQRMLTKSLGKRDHVHHIKPEPAKADEIDIGPFTTASGIEAYRVHRQWDNGRGVIRSAISLPHVSILGRAIQHREG